MVVIAPAFFAAGGNRHSAAADWSDDLLAFGAGANIALWGRDISALLPGHQGNVQAVRILRHHSSGHTFLITGAADSTVRVFQFAGDARNGYQEPKAQPTLNRSSRSTAQPCTLKHVLEAHAGAINAISTLPNAQLFVTAAADATIVIWQFDDSGEDVQVLQHIKLTPRYLPLTCALAELDGGGLVLAVAGTRSSIQLYSCRAVGEQFSLQATLTGHEGWIRSLDFTADVSAKHNDILLASASQDKYVRLWRFHKDNHTGIQSLGDPLPAGAKRSLSNKTQVVGSAGHEYSVTFEALLIGHEDWIYTARWQPKPSKNSIPALLTASADNSLAIWRADESSGLWVCQTRLGEISSQKGSTTATGSTGGFWIGLWRSDGTAVASLGRTGSWRKWEYDSSSDLWTQCVGVSGHTDDVRSLAWSPNGTYLLSTSADQTTRIFAEWKHGDLETWHEFARPQIHGYDLNCISAISSDRFVSGADEKLLRVFNKPKAIDEVMSRLCGIPSTVDGSLPDMASIPVLGLSNKAVAAALDGDNEEAINEFEAVDADAQEQPSGARTAMLPSEHPPLEEHLARHTLWPEHEKLYGHGFEICAVAASHEGSLLATACKASSIDHAVIRIYETGQWREVKPPLTAHSLTVTSMAFSPDDQYLLSVGRDRQWAVFARQDDSHTYKLLLAQSKGHSRMILDCSWAPQSMGAVFATAGRDKAVKIWKLSSDTGSNDSSKAECIATISATAPVTAVAFAEQPFSEAGGIWLGYGTDQGTIQLCTLDSAGNVSASTTSVPDELGPCKAVNVLRWRPARARAGAGEVCTSAQLAVGSEDTSVRIYDVLHTAD